MDAKNLIKRIDDAFDGYHLFSEVDELLLDIKQYLINDISNDKQQQSSSSSDQHETSSSVNVMDQLYNFFKSYGINKMRVIDIWNEFLFKNELSAEHILTLGEDDRFKRVITLTSPTRNVTLAKYDSIGDVPMMWEDEFESFFVDNVHVDVWYELNE